MEPLSLSAQHLQGVVVVTISGDVDATSAGRLDAFLRETRRDPRHHVVFDLTEMTFLDSAGLRVLLNTYTHARQHGADVHLAALQSRPARVIEITQVDRYLKIHATPEQALAAALDPSAADDPPGGHGTNSA
jgi:anti-anti-sigma factor